VHVIVLDTNQLEAAQPPNGPILTLLGKIAAEAGHELAIPQMALHEHMAHVRHDIERTYAELQSAKRTLHLLVPLGRVIPPTFMFSSQWRGTTN
jgi:hypothetical protein